MAFGYLTYRAAKGDSLESFRMWPERYDNAVRPAAIVILGLFAALAMSLAVAETLGLAPSLKRI